MPPCSTLPPLMKIWNEKDGVDWEGFTTVGEIAGGNNLLCHPQMRHPTKRVGPELIRDRWRCVACAASLLLARISLLTWKCGHRTQDGHVVLDVANFTQLMSFMKRCFRLTCGWDIQYCWVEWVSFYSSIDLVIRVIARHEIESRPQVQRWPGIRQLKTASSMKLIMAHHTHYALIMMADHQNQ